MSCAHGALRRRQLRAPKRHGEALIEPPLSLVGELLRCNAARLAAGDVDLGGIRLSRLAALAREELLREARSYTRQYRDIGFASTANDVAEARILLAGHQPQLFHPGVWLKNFVLSGLARRQEAVGINLLIDNDLARTASIRVPGGSIEEPVSEAVPLDLPAEPVPYERRMILDPDLFRSFGRRVVETIAPLVPDPLVVDLWPLAEEAGKRTGNLGLAVAQARHSFEAQWGAQTLEVPLSRLCQGESFGRFAAHLLAELPRLREVYNASVTEYRKVNRVRSRSHPVPDLVEEAGWIEAPLWIWTTQDPRRARLFVAREGDELILTDRRQLRLGIPAAGNGGNGATAEAILSLSQRGICLRPRALVTTMLARLCLGDLFLHGIGGAKYDQLTDLIMTQFFRLEPPEYLVVTGTQLLPIPRPPVAEEDLRRIDELLRELRFHPEQHLDGEESAVRADSGSEETVAQLVAAKRRWIQTDPPRHERRRRHEEIQRVNAALAPRVEGRRELLLAERERLVEALRREALLGSREYSYCLFPQETLRRWILDLLAKDV